MAKDKKMVEAITSMEEDFAQWYTDVVKKAELCDYTSVKGCMVIKPAGYAIWELIQKELDARFKAVGVQNVYLPMFIPESDLLQRPCSVISIRMTSIPTETCLRYTISGVPWYVGRRRPDLSCVPESSCGRKDIPHMLLQKNLRRELCRC